MVSVSSLACFGIKLFKLFLDIKNDLIIQKRSSRFYNYPCTFYISYSLVS